VSDVPSVICKVCGRPLARVTQISTGDEVRWEHFEQDQLQGHKPVPVDPAEGKLRGRCDFCNAEGPEYVLPVRDFTAGRRPDGMMQAYYGNWAACSSCAQLIERNAWTSLMHRRVARWEEEHGIPAPPDKKAAWAHLWRLMRRHIAGSIKPI
jgi:hypothetical protein